LKTPPAGIATAGRSTPPPPSASRPFRFPPFSRHRLANGMQVLVAPLSGFPLLTLELVLPAGGENDPPGQAGLGSLTAGLLDEGTAHRGALEIATAAEHLGGYLASGVDWDVGYVVAGALARHWRQGLELLAEVATSPTFPAPEIERLRRQRLAEILRRAQDPGYLADRGLQRAVYEGTRYAEPLIGTKASLTGFDAAAIRSFYARHYDFGRATLIAVGELDPAALLATCAAVFGESRGDREGGESPPPIVPRPLATTSVFLVDRPGAAQTEICLGHAGLPRTHPEWATTTVLNSILGGKFTSRINLNLRERYGFTYGASSRFLGRRGPGPFAVTAAVATGSAGRAVHEVLGELRRIRAEPVAAEELAETKSYIGGVFPYTLQTIDDLAKRLDTLATYDLPDDYFDRYLERVGGVTAEDVLAAAQRFLDPDHLAIVAVGPTRELEPQLADLGPIVNLVPEEA
jgi:predicted Zn-dependent peptidase